MLSNIILDFLYQLKENNSREWLNTNKELYETAKTEFENFAFALMTEINKFDKDIPIVPVKDCIFRIHRDVRFSPDKTPYKTNFGVYFSKGGKKGPFCGYYFHIQPEECFASGGLYMPLPKVLKAVRQEIFEYPEHFLEIIEEKKFKKLFGELWGEKLKKAPKDFPADFKHIELLKMKSWVSMHNINEKKLTDPDLLNYLLDLYKTTYDLNNYLNKIVNDCL